MMVAFEPGHRLTVVKNVSLAEDHLHDHFAYQPIMPASLMLEGMAQTAGVLVGSTRGFKEKVILAKIGSATIDADVIPGQTIRYDAVIERVDESGAAQKALFPALITVLACGRTLGPRKLCSATLTTIAAA